MLWVEVGGFEWSSLVMCNCFLNGGSSEIFQRSGEVYGHNTKGKHSKLKNCIDMRPPSMLFQKIS